MTRFERVVLVTVWLAFSLVVVLLTSAAVPQEAKKLKPRLDDFGDPLPEHAVLRIGTVRLRPGGYVESLAFSEDGKKLATVTRDNGVQVWRVDDGSKHRHEAASSAVSRRMLDIIRNDKWVYHRMKQTPEICEALSDVFRWDLTSYEEQEVPLQIDGGTGTGFVTEDGKLIVTGPADSEVTIWDANTGKRLRTLEGKQNGMTLAAVSTDGKLLAAACDGCVVHIWDLTTGKRLHNFEGHAAPWVNVRFAAGGKTIISEAGYGHEEACTLKFWNASQGKKLRDLRSNGTAVVSGDGNTLATLKNGHAHITDVESNKKIAVFPVSEGAFLVQMSEDGRYLAGQCAKPLEDVLVQFAGVRKERHKTAEVWDVRTGKRVFFDNGGRSAVCWFTSDSRFFVVHKPGRTMVRILLAVPIAPAGDREFQTLPGGLVLWDLARSYKSLPGPAPVTTEMASVSPSGRLIALVPDITQSVLAPGFQPATATPSPVLEVRELATGALVGSVYLPGSKDVVCVVFSPDSSMLAVGLGDGAIVIWDLLTEKELVRLSGHSGSVYSLGFSPDGRQLVSGGSSDTAIVVWDVSRWTTLREGVEKLALDGSMADWWRQLAQPGNEGKGNRAYAIVAGFLKTPSKTVDFLAQRLKPAPAVLKERISELITLLGSSRYAEREKATVELEKLGLQALTALHKALEKESNAEVGLRVRELLSKIEDRFSSELLQANRGLEILEMLGTPAAAELLESLSRGSPDAWLTQEAEWALKRVRKRPMK